MLGLARAEVDLDSLRALPDDEVGDTLGAARAWPLERGLVPARALARANAWPAGDLGLRKAVSHFYGEGRMLDEVKCASSVSASGYGGSRRARSAGGTAGERMSVRTATTADLPALKELWLAFERDAAARIHRDGQCGRAR